VPQKWQMPYLEGDTDSEGKVKKLLESIELGLPKGLGLGRSLPDEGGPKDLELSS
jgi:hypothetical protein